MLCDQCQTVEHCTKHGCIPSVTVSALDTQIGGQHYKDKAIQPVEFIHANHLGFCEGNVVKYISRWRQKNGIADLQKAKHYLELLIELESSLMKKTQPR
jgi:hypothetical protein